MEKKKAPEVNNFTVGNFTVLASRNLISDGHEDTPITPKMLSVLTELAKHQEQTLSKEHLIMAVWGTHHTSDMVLSRAISDLRKVFADSAKKQSYIETVSKQGYRLKQKVTWLGPSLSPRTNTNDPIQAIVKEELKPRVKVPKYKINMYKTLTLLFFVIIISAFLYFKGFFSKEDKEVNTSPALTKITSDSFTKRFVRFSADGKYIAYSVGDIPYKGGRIRLQSLIDHSVIFVDESSSNAKGENIVSYDHAPAFSPSGEELAYKHLEENSCAIFIVNLVNFAKRKVSDCPFSKTDALDWSSDGKHLVNTVFNPINNIESLVLVDVRKGDMNVLPPPTSKASGYLWPRFSPDNEDIAVVHFQPNDNLWTIGKINIETGEFSEILASRDEISQVVWDESGTIIYYLVVGGANEGISKVDTLTKTSHRIMNTKSASIDFDEINQRFVSIEREVTFDIWQTIHNLDGEVISESKFENFPQTHSPSLSPSDKTLAFISTNSSADSLWLNTLETNQNTLLYQGEKNEKLSDPRWNPSNEELLITVLNNGKSRIVKINLELGNAVNFIDKDNVKMAKWSQDGNMLYWYEQIENTWHVVEKNLASKNERTILSHPISRFEIDNSKQIQYQKIGTKSVHSRPLKNENSNLIEEKKLFSSIHSFAWDTRSDMSFYLSHVKAGAKPMVYSFDFNTGKSKELYSITAAHHVDSGRQLSVSQDGRIAFYPRVGKHQTDIVIINLQ